MKNSLCVFFLVLFISLNAQVNCAFKNDTLLIPQLSKTFNAQVLETQLKKSVVQFAKTDQSKLFLKITVTENLYFDMVDRLEIVSGSKSFTVKDAKQYQLDKHAGYFIIELYKNYVGTLKDDGITALIFNKAQTNFSKQDCALVKQAARCFYESISIKK